MIALLITFISFSICFLWYKYRFSYWKIRGIPSLNPNILLGDVEAPWKGIPACVQCMKMYNTFKNQHYKHGGFFGGTLPIYLPTDPEYIKNILTADFNYFASRGLHPNERILQHLFTQEGNKWKTLRQKLSSTFSSGKMKIMFNTMLECSDSVIIEIERLTINKETIDMKDLAAKYNIDVIGSCAFGIEYNRFGNKSSDFQKYGSMIFEQSVSKSLKALLIFNYQYISSKLGITILEKEAATFFSKLVTEIYNYRKENNIQHSDLMQRLIELKEKEIELQLTLDDVIAQSYAFFVGGFDTTSSMITLCFFEIAVNYNVQIRLREEIKNILSLHKGKITYEAIKDMKYMDQVINETMRKYPVVPLLTRECTKTYKIPFTDSVLDKGTLVAIPILGLHRDPTLFADPEKFDPERFSEENQKKIISGTYNPFGNGPRICIGMRFGLLQAKIFLATVIKNFEFSLNSRTKIPLELDLKFTTSAKGGVWLNSKKIF